MGDLVRALIVSGLLSGTQPVTIMGLLLVMAGANPQRNGWAFVAGAFVVETTLVLGASILFGSTVSPSSAPGVAFLVVRIVVGVALVIFGVLLRRPPGKPIPEIPNALARLQALTPTKAFVAGLVLADYQGPILASLAIAAGTVSLGGRLLAVGFFTLIASGIPVAIILVTTRSARAHERLTTGTTWVMRNRRRLASWFALVVGTLLAADSAWVLAHI